MIKHFFHWLEGRVEVFPQQPPERPPNRFWGFMYYYTKPFLPLLMVSALLATCVAIIDVYVLSLVGSLVDVLSTANRATFWQDHGTWLLFASFLVLIISPLLSFFDQSVLHLGLRGNFSMRIRWLAHRYVLRQSLDFFQNDFAGRVATKVMQAAISIRDTSIKAVEIINYILVYFLAALFMVAQTDYRLMIPLLVWAVAYIALGRYYIPKISKYSEEQSDLRSMVTGRLVDSYTNISTVKLFAHADREEAYARDGMGRMLDSVYIMMRTVTSMVSLLALLSGLLVFSMTALAIWLWYNDAAPLGAIAFSLALTIRLKAMSQWIIWELSDLFENIGITQDSLKTISQDRKVSDVPGAKPLAVTSGDIRFDHVTFNYNKPITAETKPVLDNFSLHVKPGEKIGLVGRSGAGKSTVASLLLRFYDVASGAIIIDGQNIHDVTQKSLRSTIGVVTQDTSLLHRSVIDNLRYGMPEATPEEVESAARKIHAHDFITTLTDLGGRKAYDAHVGERGVKLSGGQRQRIAIARVLLKNAPILVLDEATSALDSEVEAAIQESLYTLMEGKTVIAVAHRLSTIAAMDRLVIMDKGRIIEMGSHQELLEQGGLYAKLWKHQSGGFLVDDEN